MDAKRFAPALAILVVLPLGGCLSSTPRPTGDPDPGGVAQAALRQADEQIGTGTIVTDNQGVTKPGWSSCDGERGTFGWGHLSMRELVQPRTNTNFLRSVDRLLDADGWHQDTTNALSRQALRGGWSRGLPTGVVATVHLRFAEHLNAWVVSGYSPTLGPQAHGC